jgi:hypothetical protein
LEPLNSLGDRVVPAILPLGPEYSKPENGGDRKESLDVLYA